MLQVWECLLFNTNNISSLTIGSGLTEMGNSTFRYNNLSSVTIPNNIIIIRASAFRDNPLETVTIGDGVTSIETRAFENPITGPPDINNHNICHNTSSTRF